MPPPGEQPERTSAENPMEMTNADKLILIMLSEIYEHLGIGGVGPVSEISLHF